MGAQDMKVQSIFDHWRDESHSATIKIADLQKYTQIISRENLETEADILNFLERLDAEERGDGFVLDGTSSEESSESERSMERSEDSDRTHPKNKQEQSEEVEVENASQKQRLSTEKHESLKIMKKLVLLKQIFKKVQERVEEDLVKCDPTLAGQIQWTHTLSAGETKSGIACVMPDKKGHKQSIFVNVNVNEMLKLPGDCAMAAILGKVQRTIVRSKDKAFADSYTKLINNSFSEQDYDFKKDDVHDLIDGKRQAIIKALAQHYSRIFPAEFSDYVKDGVYSLKGCSAHALYTAKLIVSDMSDEELRRFPEKLFHTPTLKEIEEFTGQKDLKDKGVEIGRDFLLGDIVTFSYIYNLDKNLADKSDLLLDMSQDVATDEQAREVIKRYANSKFMEKHRAKMLDTNKGKGQFTKEDIKDFCEEYSSMFMRAHNLQPIKLEYVTSGGDKGTYVDFGRTHVIRINCAKVENFVDLMATLTHELTHAVDSSRNKVHGRYNEKTGGGLMHSLSDFDMLQMAGSMTKEQFEKFKKEYYLTNYDEVRGRCSEYDALTLAADILKGVDLPQELKSKYQTIISGEQKRLDGLNNQTLDIMISRERNITVEQASELRQDIVDMLSTEAVEEKDDGSLVVDLSIESAVKRDKVIKSSPAIVSVDDSILEEDYEIDSEVHPDEVYVEPEVVDENNSDVQNGVKGVKRVDNVPTSNISEEEKLANLLYEQNKSRGLFEGREAALSYIRYVKEKGCNVYVAPSGEVRIKLVVVGQMSQPIIKTIMRNCGNIFDIQHSMTQSLEEESGFDAEPVVPRKVVPSSVSAAKVVASKRHEEIFEEAFGEDFEIQL